MKFFKIIFRIFNPSDLANKMNKSKSTLSFTLVNYSSSTTESNSTLNNFNVPVRHGKDQRVLSEITKEFLEAR